MMDNGSLKDKLKDRMEDKPVGDTISGDQPKPSGADLKSAADDILKAARVRERKQDRPQGGQPEIAAQSTQAESTNQAPGSTGGEAATTDSALADTDPTPEQKIAGLEAENADLRDQLLRALAELENVRKRSVREKADARTYAIEGFARDLLSVSDNMARALQVLPEAERAQLGEAGTSLLSGVEMTQKELHAILTRHGIHAIDAKPGASFDPNLHQAVANVVSDHPTGTIASLFQAGWRIGERTLRAAMVAVSKADTAKPENTDDKDSETHPEDSTPAAGDTD